MMFIMRLRNAKALLVGSVLLVVTYAGWQLAYGDFGAAFTFKGRPELRRWRWQMQWQRQWQWQWQQPQRQQQWEPRPVQPSQHPQPQPQPTQPQQPVAFSTAWIDDHVAAAGVGCDRLIAGDAEHFDRAQRYLAGARSSLSCADSDARLANASCENLLAAGYARTQSDASGARSDEDFPLAFGLRMHKCAAQAELLLRSLYEPQNVYCVHVDAKAGDVVIAAMRRVASCLPNVYLAPSDDDFVYASVSQLRADLTCMRLLLAARTPSAGAAAAATVPATLPWRYFLNVAGQELPLRTNRELVALLRSYNGSNEVLSMLKPFYSWRYTERVFCKLPVEGFFGDGAEKPTTVAVAAALPKAVRTKTAKCEPAGELKSPPPGNVTVYKGLGYGFYSRAFVEYMLRDGGLGAELFAWFEDTWAPDEHYYATLARLADAPGGYTTSDDARLKSRTIRWQGANVAACGGKFVRKVCVYGVRDLPWLVLQPEAIANKFHLDYDPIVVQCLAEWVRRRAVEPPTAPPLQRQD